MDSETPPSPAANPEHVYGQRRDKHIEARTELEAADGRFATARGLTFLVGLALAWFALIDGSLPALWLLAPIGVFIGLVVGHARSARRLELARKAVAWYDRSLDRLADKWEGVGVSGERYRDDNHPYANDLDIFGAGSLFQLLCGSRTRLGEDTLAGWLSNGSDLETIRKRQQGIDELRDQIDFREQMALLDAEVHDEFDQNELRKWVASDSRRLGGRPRVIATILGVCAAVTLIGWAVGFGISPFLIVVVFEILFFAALMRQIQHIAGEAEAAGSGLKILSQVLELLESHQFETPSLKDLRAALDTDGHPPSWQIHRLRSLIETLNNSLQNQFFAPIAFLLGLPVHIADRIEQWRDHVGPHIPDWLDAVGQIESLSSLAGYAFEHPEDPFPELVSESDGPCFEAQELGHPLIADDKVIRNNVSLTPELRLIMVSGSNMSGKSTLLRTIGINSVLALCGAPVRAESLKLSPLVIGTAMRVSDSLQHGESLFYSVISRMKSVVELAGSSPPLLFLLDEILQGTNSHDRRVGAEGIIHQLVDRGAIGLVTTHDLALTGIVESFGGQADNIHFEDHLVNGRMYFDYRIRPGVVQKSNALELMRMIGLEVGDEPEHRH